MRSVLKISTVSLITALAILVLQCEGKDKFYLPDLPEQICAAGLIDIDDTLHYAICNSSTQASSKKIFFEKSFQSIDSLGSDYLRELNFRISDGKEDIFTKHIYEPFLNPGIEIPSDLKFESGRKYFFRAGERDAPDISAECIVPGRPPELTLVSLKTWFDIQNFKNNEICFSNNRGKRESTYTRRYAEIEFTFINTNPESYYALFLIGSPKHYREDIFGIGLVAPSFINYDIIESNTYGFKQTFIGGLTIHSCCYTWPGGTRGTYCESDKLYTYFIDGNKIPGGNCIIKISTYWDNIQYMPSFIEYFRVRLMSIPKEAYLFYKSLYISTAQVDDPFAQPVNVNGNVSGGNGIIALCRSRDLIVFTGQTGGRFDSYF